MRQAAKRDWAEQSIVMALRAVGIRVQRLSDDGVADLLAFHPHEGLKLLEVKGPRGRLTAHQRQRIAEGWPVQIVHSVEEALQIFGIEVYAKVETTSG